jgi:hypothetical protein
VCGLAKEKPTFNGRWAESTSIFGRESDDSILMGVGVGVKLILKLM